MRALPPSHALVLHVLTEAADHDKVCPTNDELAGLIGGDAGNTSYVLAALKRRGLITVQTFARTRQVTIVASGRSTRLEGSAAAHWRSKAPSLALGSAG